MHSSQKLKWGCIRCPTISVDLCFSQMIFRHHRAYWWKLSSCIFYPNSLRVYVSLGGLALRGLRLLLCNLFWISRPPQHDGLALWVLMLAFWLPIPLIRIDIPCPWCCVQRHSLLALAARDESGNWSVLPFPAICVTPSRILSRGVLLLPLMAGDFQHLRFVSLKLYTPLSWRYLPTLNLIGHFVDTVLFVSFKPLAGVCYISGAAGFARPVGTTQLSEPPGSRRWYTLRDLNQKQSVLRLKFNQLAVNILTYDFIFFAISYFHFASAVESFQFSASSFQLPDPHLVFRFLRERQRGRQ